MEILLVDDSPSDVRLIREGLKEATVPFALSVARDGDEAIRYLHHEAVRADLMLLDMNLPRKDGAEVLSEVRAHPRTRRLPVVVLTSSRRREDVERMYDLHANAYVRKPATLDELVAMLRAVESFWMNWAVLPSE